MFEWEVVSEENVIGVHVGDGNLCSRAEPEVFVVVLLVVAAAESVGIVDELGELAGATH